MCIWRCFHNSLGVKNALSHFLQDISEEIPWCFSMSSLLLNCSLQYMNWNNWWNFIRCLFRDPDCMKDSLHTLHGKGFSPVWSLICIFMLSLLPVLKPHIRHSYGFLQCVFLNALLIDWRKKKYNCKTRSSISSLLLFSLSALRQITCQINSKLIESYPIIAPLIIPIDKRYGFIRNRNVLTIRNKVKILKF